MRLFQRNRQQQPSSQADTSADSTGFQRQCEELIPAEVRMISGCHSEQTSADVSNVQSVAQLPNPAGRAGGACTSALLEILYRRSNQPLTFQDVLLQLRSSLARKGLSQIPQLTSSRPLELQKTPFSLVGSSTGRRRAVLVGINYRGQSGELSGCHNDVFNVKKYIVEHHGYPNAEIVMLIDDGRYLYPTRQKIIEALRKIVAQSVAGDSVYFHYSGHGGLLSPQENSFKNGNNDYDETLYPVDHARSGQIRDFSLFNHFVKPMAAGVTVTCVMDCCHSGAVLDLPYSFQPTPGGTIRMRENMNSLSNLAFLYILAGGILPHGFGNVIDNLEETVDGDLDGYQGVGVEEMQETDMADYMYGDNTTDDFGAGAGYGQDAPGDWGAGDGEVPVVQGLEPDAYYGPSGDLVQYVAVPGTDVSRGYDAYGGTGDNIVVPGAEISQADYGGAVFGAEVPQADYNYGGYGDFGGNGQDYDARGFNDTGGDEDCGCLADILGALMEQE